MHRALRASRGFTLIETLMVLAIIGIMAAVALPNVLSYMRQFRIRGAMQEVTSAIQQARTKAIMKSSEHGVVFAVENINTYWVHIEDDQSIPQQGARQVLNLSPNTTDLAQSARYRLPDSIIFADAATCTPAPAGGFAPTDAAVRFNRLGTMCDPGGAATCAALPAPTNGALAPNLIQNDGTRAHVCLRDTRSGMVRWIRIERGGRVEGQR